MNIALWIVAGLVALGFLFAGVNKIAQPREKLQQSMAWVEDFSPTQIKLIGAAEVLGAIGLIVPPLTGIAPILAPIAATGLVVVMVGAAITHLRRGERPVIGANVVLGLLAAFVAVGRFFIAPF